MITSAQAKQILNATGENYSDEDAKALLETFYRIGRVQYDNLMRDSREFTQKKNNLIQPITVSNLEYSS